MGSSVAFLGVRASRYLDFVVAILARDDYYFRVRRFQ